MGSAAAPSSSPEGGGPEGPDGREGKRTGRPYGHLLPAQDTFHDVKLTLSGIPGTFLPATQRRHIAAFNGLIADVQRE
jgi:hypothetical protein